MRKELEQFYLNQIENQVDRMLAEGCAHLTGEQVDQRRDLLLKWLEQIARHNRSEFTVINGEKTI